MLIAFAGFAILAFTSCNSGSSTKDAARESLATTNTTTTTPAATPTATPEANIPAGPLTTISFPETIHDFGTVPDWPREPIAPGASSVIKVQYDSKGKGQPEGRAESKRVTLTANTDPANSYLTIKGKVFKPAGAES